MIFCICLGYQPGTKVSTAMVGFSPLQVRSIFAYVEALACWHL